MLILATVGCTGGKQTPPSTQVITTSPSDPQRAPEIDADEAKFLFEVKCSTCHSLNRPASKQKSYDAWLSTVHRMIGYGAQVTDEEAETITAYLAAEYGVEQP